MQYTKRVMGMLLCIVMLLSVCGCSFQNHTTGTPEQTNGSSGDPDWTTPPDQEDLTEEQLFSLLFDIHNTVSISLEMTDSELQKMQNDYDVYSQRGSKSPIYRMASMDISITLPEGKQYRYHLDEVGVRMKGNTSRTAFYNQEEGIYNLIHLKLSFQETFDEAEYYGADAKVWDEEARDARKDRTFATLEKMDMRWNRCDDSSYLKEYFAYETYRQYDVLAPHTNLCSFDWAGIHMGVYTINEPIDKVFLEKNLPEEALGGDLYKVGWAGADNGSFCNTNSIGIEDEDAGKFYAYDLKTNKKTSDHSALTQFIREMNSGTMTKERFAQMVDMNNLLWFSAVSYLLGNPDDMRNNYNNFYIYFRQDSGQIMFIPYDYDRCLGVTTHWNPTGDGVTGDNPFTSRLAATGQEQANPVLLYSIVEGGYFVRDYAAKIRSLADGSWFTYENFASVFAVARKNYDGQTIPGKRFYNTEGLYLQFDLERTSDFASNGNISFREYRNAKLTTMEHYLANVDKYADKTPIVHTEWYIRADATNWQNDSDYAMTVEDGLVTIRIVSNKSIRLKVYNDRTGRWYGTECIGEDCAVTYDTDSHTNIVLEAGIYRITFHPETEVITLEKE